MPGTLLAQDRRRNTTTHVQAPSSDVLDSATLQDTVSGGPLMRFDVSNPDPRIQGLESMKSVVRPVFLDGTKAPEPQPPDSTNTTDAAVAPVTAAPKPTNGPVSVKEQRAHEMGVLYAASDMEIAGFGDRVRGWGDKLGGVGLTRPSVKNLARSVEKGANDGDKAVVTQRDTLAGTVKFNSPSEMLAGMEHLNEVLEGDGCKVLRMKNRMKVGKLRDFLINVALPSGLVVELQIHLSSVIDVKMTPNKERQPKAYDAEGNGDGTPLDARGMVFGKREMHTHDAYDFDRAIDAFTDDLKQTVYTGMSHEPRLRRQLTRPAELLQTGNLDELPKAKRDKSRALQVLSVSEGAQRLKKELDGLMEGLMGEVWKDATRSNSDKEAASQLQQIASINNPAEQPLEHLEGHYDEDPGWGAALATRTAEARAALDKLSASAEDGVEPTDLQKVANVLDNHTGRFEALLKAKKSTDPAGANHITSFLKQLRALSVTIKSM